MLNQNKLNNFERFCVKKASPISINITRAYQGFKSLDFLKLPKGSTKMKYVIAKNARKTYQFAYQMAKYFKND